MDYYKVKDEHGHKHLFRVHERKKLILATTITGTVFIVEVIGGVITNSLALISDAGHMLTHIFALLVSLFALYFAARPPTLKKTYGFYRLEIIAALFNGIVLFMITLWIFYEAYHRFMHPETISSGKMFIVAVIGLIANVACAYILMKGGNEIEHSLNVRSAIIHMLGDTFSSVGVIVGAIIIYYTHWYIVDPIISILLCILILVWAYKLIMESVDILLEATPKEINIGEVADSLKQIPGVDNVHDIHIWTITSGMYSMSAHVDTRDMLISETTKLSKQINCILSDKFRIGHTVIQFGCECEINSKQNSHNHNHI
ncbi:MAG: cation transporter [wastewater metagenome]|nr:cation transporter [Candidatus Loosdrechtia aerotolerans]